MNRPPKEAGRPEAKFVYTVYRKSEATPETLQDIWRVLLWELQALQHGRKALLGQEGVRLEDQVSGDYVGQRWGRWHGLNANQGRLELVPGIDGSETMEQHRAHVPVLRCSWPRPSSLVGFFVRRALAGH